MLLLLISIIIFILLLFIYKAWIKQELIILPRKIPATKKKMCKFPLTFHQTFRHYQIPKTFYTQVIEKNCKLNPEFDFYFYDNHQQEIFIQQHFESKVYNAYKKINPKYGACLSDFARYCILYIKGGCYLDIKSMCKKPLYDYLEKQDAPKLIVSHWYLTQYSPIFSKLYCSSHVESPNGEIINWVFASTPRHPVLKKIIDTVVNNIQTYNFQPKEDIKLQVMKLTGPIMLTNVIYDCIKDPRYQDTILIDYQFISNFYYEKLSLPCMLSCKNLLYSRKNKHYSKLDQSIIKSYDKN